MKKTLRLIEKDIRQDYSDYCKDKNLDPKNRKSKNQYLKDFTKWYAQYNGLSTLNAAKEKVKKELEEDNILGQETPDETIAKIDSASKGLYPADKIQNQEVLDKTLNEDEEKDNKQRFIDYCNGRVEDLGMTLVNNNDYDPEDEEDSAQVSAKVLLTSKGIRQFSDVRVVARDEEDWESLVAVDKDGNIVINSPMLSVDMYALRMEFDMIDPELYNSILEYWDEQDYDEMIEDLSESALTEDVDTGRDEDNDTVDEIADEMQDETGAEEEEKDSSLDAQLEDLREILPDLELHLYQVTDKEDTNRIFYFVGKVADDSNDVLMLANNNPYNKAEVLEIEKKDEDREEEELDGDEPEDKFDFVKIPDKYEDLAALNPRYGDELNPEHEDLMEYLMKCLVKKSPERAEEIASEKNIIDNDEAEIPLDPEVQDDIDNKIEHYSNKI